MTFGITFFLTALSVPLVYAGLGQSEISAEAYFGLLFFGAIPMGIGALLKTVVFAAIVFFPLFRAVSLVAAPRLAYVGCASIAALFSASIALIVNIDVYPFAVVIMPEIGNFAITVGSVAALIALFVSSLQMAAKPSEVPVPPAQMHRRN